MDAETFDAVTQRLSGLLTRRRSLGVLAALGLSTGLLTDDADAKKHKKKKKKGHKHQPLLCTGCAACETCVDGTCQLAPDGTVCGDGRVCRHGGCGKACDQASECPDALCVTGRTSLETNVCATNDDDRCAAAACANDASCPRGSVCALRFCGADAIKYLCWTLVLES